ncbi:putative cytochrome c oxidase subunit 5c [Dioscorea sansibarensis]
MTKDASRKKRREGKAAVISRSKSKVKRRNSMAAHVILKGPSVVKEICIGLTLGLFAGGLWKMHHWNEQRKTRAFYDMLEKGQISVVASEE